MGRLKAMPSQLSTLKPRLGFVAGDEKAADKSRTVMAPWRAWYKTERWARLRHAVFLRDLYKCQRSDVLVIGKYPAPNSPVANHKVPHKGDPDLFWDIDNIETVSKEVHDGLIQSEERALPRT